jgi:putative peptidoglycan lipid II flippase
VLARARSIVTTMLPKGAVVLSVLTFGVYAMGLLRDKALAHTFGAGAEWDAYNAAFVLPELALDVLVAGGLVAPFVPLFVGLRGEAEERARAFGRTILTLAVIVMAIASAVLFVLAPETAAIVAPKWTGEQRDLYVGLFRVMCFTPVIFAASIVLGEILVAERRFLFFGLAPIMYSGGIIAGTVLLSEPLGIYGAAVGAVAGALIHLGVRLVGIYRTRFRPRPSLDLHVKGLREFLWLMAPKMVSQPIEPLTFLYFTSLASTLAAGSVTDYNIARNFQGMPVSLIGMSFAIAAFPALSAAAASGNRRAFGRTFGTNLTAIVFFATGAAVCMFLFGGLAIRILLGGGAFDDEDVRNTTLILAVFSFSVPLESVSHLLARAIYATHNTILPTAAVVAGFAATVVSAQALGPEVGLAAIPASYTIGMGLRLVILALALAPRIARMGVTTTPAEPIAPPGMGAPSGRWTRPSRPRQVVLAVALICLAGSTVFALSQTVPNALSGGPQTTPWERERSPAIPPTPEPALTFDPLALHTPGAPQSPWPTVTPGPFEMDLYQEGDFVGEKNDTWCVPAAMQTSMNIMDEGADTTRATQAKLWDLAIEQGGTRSGGAEPEGWAKGLTSLGYGNYKVGSQPSMAAAVKIVAKQIRMTNRPAGLIVWKGWHSWVVSGFKSTADPYLTDNYQVTALYIEDVWYPRLSSLWNQDRGGASRPPDSLVPYSALGVDYLKFHQAHYYEGKEGRWVYIIPVD